MLILFCFPLEIQHADSVVPRQSAPADIVKIFRRPRAFGTGCFLLKNSFLASSPDFVESVFGAMRNIAVATMKNRKQRMDLLRSAVSYI